MRQLPNKEGKAENGCITKSGKIIEKRLFSRFHECWATGERNGKRSTVYPSVSAEQIAMRPVCLPLAGNFIVNGSS